MRNVLKLFPAIFLLTSLFIFQSCAPHAKWEKESAALLVKTAALEDLHHQLDDRIDSLWDATTAQLAVMIPSDFPQIDREIFLKARNADHIRMFMSYSQLSADAKALINDAGDYDQFLAQQIHQLIIQKEKFEEEKNLFLTKVQHEDEEASRLYADKFRMASLELFR
ncbi:MAG TPA: hypothetical protein VMZ69_04135 [Saprospiraceae bacterium]|nr:hypothetical protein [Saprospiraceae bacterium]